MSKIFIKKIEGMNWTAKISLVLIFTIALCAHMVMGSDEAEAATYYSRATANWAVNSTWSTAACGGAAASAYPVAGDTVTICNGNTVTMAANAAAGTVTIATGGTLNKGTVTLTCDGLVIAGNLTAGNGGSTTVNGNVSGAGSITAGATPRVFNVTGDWTFNGTITAGDAIALNMNGTGNQTLSGTIYNNTAGSLTINKSSGTVTLGSAMNVGTGTFTLTAGTFDPATYLLTAATRTFTAGTLRVGGANWAANYSGAITQPAAGTIEYYASGAQTINNIAYPGHLTLSGSGVKTLGAGITSIGGNLVLSGTASATLLANVSIGGNLNIGSGAILDLSTFTANRSAAGGTLTVAGTLILGGTSGGQTGSNFPTNFTTVTLTGGTVEYDAAGNQTVYNTPTYNNLTITGSGTKTLGGVTTVNGNVTINTGATLATGNNNLSVKGNWTKFGSFTPGTATVTFNGTGGQTINSANTWYGLAVTGGGRTVTFESGVRQTVTNSLTFNGSGTTLTLAPSSSPTKWELNAPATQTISNVSVSYSDASSGTAVNATGGTNTDGGNNINWIFTTAGTLQFTSATYSENENVGTTTTITVSRTGGSTGAVSVDCVTSDGTATTADSDYTGGTYTLNWANGDSANKTCNVPINNDTKDENDETVNLTLANVAGGATIGAQNTAVLTITDNDPLPTVQFQAATSSGSEATTPAVINVTLSTASGKTVTVNYATANGTATAGSDYTSASGTLTFNPGVTSQSINVTIAEDVAAEANETFIITLSSPSNATLGGTTTHTYTINDNDTITLPTVSLINPKPGTSTVPTVISLRPTTNDFKVQVKVWTNAAISADTVQVGYYTGATPEVGPFTWVTAALNTNYPNAANYGVYEAWLSPPVGNYYLMARASEDAGVTYGYSRDNRTGNDARYIYVSVKAANTGTGMILARDSSSQLCLDCHNLATHSSETTDASYGNWQIGCLECHTPHSTKNIYLINGTITTPNSGNKTVIFYNTDGDAANSYVDSSAGGTTTGICQACHTQTKDSSTSNARWRNSGNSDPAHYQAGGLNGTQRCTSCHVHTSGFRGSCDTCHNSPPTTGKHAIHFATGSVNYGSKVIQSSTSAYGFSCGICHYGTHLNTLPQLPNPHTVEVIFSGIGTQDSAGAASYAPAGFSIDDPGMGWTFNYSDGTCSNVYCHGKYPGSGKNATVTFSTGTAACGSCHETSNTTVPASGSHSKHALDTNYNYACTRCHNNVVGGTGPASYTIADKSKHVNGYIDWAFDSFTSTTAAYNIISGTAMPSDGTTPRAYSNCSSTYCHSNGTSVATSSIPGNTSPNWGSGSAACNSCHGNTTYPSDYRMSGPLYDSASPKQNAHRPHIAAGSISSGETQCKHCHYKTTNDNTTIASKTLHVNKAYDITVDTIGNQYAYGEDVSTTQTVTAGYSGGSCSSVSCHPNGIIDATFNTNTSLTIPWADKDSSNYQCTDCHKIDLVNTATYQHSMNTVTYTPNPASESDYLTTVPEGSATAGTNPSSRKCLMCHVKHNIFSDRMNSSIVAADARAANLRSNYSQIPTKTLYYGSKDYFNAAVPGVCLGCHQAERTKDTTRQKTEANSTKTPAISVANYDVSAHKYEVTTTTKTTTKTLYANCAKCHNSKNGETATFQNATIALRPRQFGVHASPARRLLSALGGTLVENYEENFCYRCHSKQTDAIGGTKKSVDANDWYGATGISMPAAATNIFAAFYDNPTTTPTAKTYSHKVASYSGLHKPSPTDETQSYMTANKHVECGDCHNVHAATSTNATKSARGANPTNSTTNWTAPTSYAESTVNGGGSTITNYDEYQICFRCHSTYAWITGTASGGTTTTLQVGGTPWTAGQWVGYAVQITNTTSTNAKRGASRTITANTNNTLTFSPAVASNVLNGDSYLIKWDAAWTDTAKEFNVNNASYHWVEGDKTASSGSTPRASTTYGNFNMTYVYKMMPRYNGYTNAQLRVVKMRCSDCHGPSNAENNPNGPHGSAYAKILKVPVGSTYTVWDNTKHVGDTDVWCFNCHVSNFTNSGFSGPDGSLHTSKHNADKGPCFVCHIKVPHGWRLMRLLRPANMAANYPYDNEAYNGPNTTSGLSPDWTFQHSGNWTESGANSCEVSGSHQNCSH